MIMTANDRKEMESEYNKDTINYLMELKEKEIDFLTDDLLNTTLNTIIKKNIEYIIRDSDAKITNFSKKLYILNIDKWIYLICNKLVKIINGEINDSDINDTLIKLAILDHMINAPLLPGKK